MEIKYQQAIIPPFFNLLRENDEPNYPEDYELAEAALQLLDNQAGRRDLYYDHIRYFINPELSDEELSRMPQAEFQQLLVKLREEAETILEDA